MFCKLTPKWCITTNSSGSHNVCVCTHHQNVKLLVDATKLNESYKELMERLVCSRENSECMLHQCDQCPGVDNLKTFLEGSFKEL